MSGDIKGDAVNGGAVLGGLTVKPMSSRLVVDVSRINWSVLEFCIR